MKCENFGSPVGDADTSTPGEFTVLAYRRLLERALERGYSFCPYGESLDGSRRQLWWRHDVDYSLNRAIALAEVEAEMGVTATIFVDVTSPYYNAHEEGQARLLRKALDFGHDLGVHVNLQSGTGDGLKSASDLEKTLRWQGAALCRITGQEPVAFSFHNPSRADLTLDRDAYAGLVNAYGGAFRTDVAYKSDSGGYWRFGPIADTLLDDRISHLQILTHPEWWQEAPMEPRDRIARCVDGRADFGMALYDDLQVALKRPNHGAMPPELVEQVKSLGLSSLLAERLWRGRFYDALEALLGHKDQL